MGVVMSHGHGPSRLLDHAIGGWESKKIPRRDGEEMMGCRVLVRKERGVRARSD